MNWNKFLGELKPTELSVLSKVAKTLNEYDACAVFRKSSLAIFEKNAARASAIALFTDTDHIAVSEGV